jgi:chemotaxis protein MotA
MFIIIGIVVAFGAVVGGFLMEHGNLTVLMQPADLVTIGGAALGAIFVANPLYIVKALVGGLTGALGGSKYGKPKYLDTLRTMFELFSRARRDGLMALETDSDNPEQSTIFSKYPKFLKDHHALAFVCGSIRMASSGGIEPFDADQMIENDMDVHHHQAVMPIAAPSTVADSLPGPGIVAAVLCYGLVGPLASNMAKSVDDEHAYYQVLRVMIVAFMKGTAPTMAVEIGRRALPGNVRPAFQEAETFIKDKGGAAAAAA